jgi:hypothetical protein
MGPSLYRWYGLSLLYVLAVLINWLGCFMLAVARSEGLEGSWLADVKVRVPCSTACRMPHATERELGSSNCLMLAVVWGRALAGGSLAGVMYALLCTIVRKHGSCHTACNL